MNQTKARLDYFLISDNTAEIVFVTNIDRACNLSDHKPINIELSPSPFVKEGGFWRLNNELLKNCGGGQP